MKFVCIYGPPATGKLTVARELVKRTDFHLFHNHHTADLVAEFFPFGSEPYSDTVFKMRQLIIEQAAKANLNGVVFTFAYAHGDNDDELKRLVGLVKKHEGDVCLVHLVAPPDVLRERVQSGSRKEHGKIKKTELLDQKLEALDFYTSFPHKDTLKIDNENVSAAKAAETIVDHFSL